MCNVLFVISRENRRIHILGVTQQKKMKGVWAQNRLLILMAIICWWGEDTNVLVT